MLCKARLLILASDVPLPMRNSKAWYQGYSKSTWCSPMQRWCNKWMEFWLWNSNILYPLLETRLPIFGRLATCEFKTVSYIAATYCYQQVGILWVLPLEIPANWITDGSIAFPFVNGIVAVVLRVIGWRRVEYALQVSYIWASTSVPGTHCLYW